MSHAILSPSAGSRWLACTRSARLEMEFPESTSEAAEEGSLAHALAELTLRRRLRRIKRYEFEIRLQEIKEHELFDASMIDHVDTYCDFVLEQYNAVLATTPDAQIILETVVDLSDFVPEGFGTVDVRIIGNGLLIIIDLKYGKGVRVTAYENKQTRIYALGALAESDYLYDISEVKLVIHQPRLDNVTEETLKVEDLKAWGDTDLKPAAALAFAGAGDFVPGDHCQFCKARGVCKANAVKNLEVEKYAETPAHLLSPEEISDILDRAGGLKNWITAVEKYAEEQAVNHGKKWPGYKLVRKGTKRRYDCETSIIENLTVAGFKADDIAPRSLLSLTNLEKKVGAQAFKVHATPHIIKPKGAPELAPLSDKRSMWDRNAQAAADFS